MEKVIDRAGELSFLLNKKHSNSLSGIKPGGLNAVELVDVE